MMQTRQSGHLVAGWSHGVEHVETGTGLRRAVVGAPQERPAGDGAPRDHGGAGTPAFAAPGLVLLATMALYAGYHWLRLIPNGAFYNDTGGSWVFVVAPDRRSAEKRQVRLGRRNSDFIEVLDGLDRGESVVTSPYTGLVDKTRLDLSTD